jgi:hypothetical protein
MTNADKAQMYDNYLRESDRLQREISKIKSEYIGKIPQHLEEQIKQNNFKIAELVGKLESLFN